MKMLEQACVCPDGYPLWVNSPLQYLMILFYFMILATKDACEGFIRAQSRQQPTTGKYKFLLILLIV